MSIETWPESLSLAFLECFHSENILWNPSHPYHKDAKIKHDSWVRISKAFGLSVPELKRKKESFMSRYRRERKKHLKRLQSGETYEPIWFAYKYMDSFLADVFKDKDDDAVLDVEEENEYRHTDRTSGQNSPSHLQADKSYSKLVETITNLAEIIVNSEKEDEVQLFCRSITTTLRGMNETKRRKTMGAVYKFIMEQSIDCNDCNIVLNMSLNKPSQDIVGYKNSSGPTTINEFVTTSTYRHGKPSNL